jgi:hypothetical protein
MATYLPARPSAGFITSGLAMVIFGAPLLTVALTSAGLDQGSRQIVAVFGWLLALPGFALLFVGIFRLARNVDLAAGVWERPAPVAVPDAPVVVPVGAAD